MTQQEFKAAFEAIEREAVAGRMSIPGALARVALLAIDYGRNDSRESRLTLQALRYRSAIAADEAYSVELRRVYGSLSSEARYFNRHDDLECQAALARKLEADADLLDG